MNRLHRATLAVAIVLLPALVSAGGAPPVRTGKSGQTIPLIFIGNCQTHRLPGSAYGSAMHGKVVVTRSTLNTCSNKNEPVLLFDYVSDPGYKGKDQATLYIGRLIWTYDVLVQ